MKTKLITFCSVLFIALGIFMCSSTPVFSQQYAKHAIWKIGGNLLDAGNAIEPTADSGYVVVGYTFSFGAGYCDVYISKVDKLGELEWTKVVGTADFEFGHSVKQTSDHGYIVSGSRLGNHSAFVIKLDATGNVLWNKTYSNNNGNSICLTADGGYAIAGWALGKISVIKIDGSGNLEWSKLYGGSQNDGAKSIQQTDDGGYFVVGSTNSFGAGGLDVYALKLAANGDIEWTKTIGDTGADYGESGQQTSDGGYIIGGYTEVFPKNGDPNHINAYIIKLSPSGELSWTKSIGGNRNDYIFSIEQTQDGGYIAGGYSNSFAGAGSSMPADSSAFYVIKIDNKGTVEWSKGFSHQANTTIVNNGTYGIRQTFDGGYVGVGTSYVSDVNFENDVFIVKLDDKGNNCEGFDVTNFELPGSQNVVSDSGTATSYVPVVLNIGMITSGGSLEKECQVDSTISHIGIKELPLKNQFLIYPNPAQNRVSISQINETAPILNSIEIYDILGRKVLDVTVNESNQNVSSVDINTLSSGVYFIKLTDVKGWKEVLKFIKK